MARKKNNKNQEEGGAVLADTVKKKDSVELLQTNGKVFNKYGVKSLDDIVGEKTTPYGGATEEEYKSSLSMKNLTDLQAHAAEMMVQPRADRNLLINDLLKKFRQVNSAYFNVVELKPLNTKKITPEILRILGEGKR